MATNKERGTKRTCQNGDCSARFYDLNRSPIVCPICSTKYVIAHSSVPISSVVAEEKRKVKKVELKSDVDEAEVEDDLVDVDTDDADEAVDDVADETFLEEEEEDGGDVSGIIGSAVDGEEET